MAYISFNIIVHSSAFRVTSIQNISPQEASVDSCYIPFEQHVQCIKTSLIILPKILVQVYPVIRYSFYNVLYFLFVNSLQPRYFSQWLKFMFFPHNNTLTIQKYPDRLLYTNSVCSHFTRTQIQICGYSWLYKVLEFNPT
jgi:hypothetical protein